MAVDTRTIFRGLQDQMEAKLTFNRAAIGHAPTKGLASELAWTEMLSTYLPERYRAASAFIIDSRGRVSDQIDIVIFDRHYSPFILRQNGVTYIPAECVYAVIEVKQTLSKTNIEYAQKKAASVRKLFRTTVPIPHAAGTYPAKKPARILAGIVALDGTVSTGAKKVLANAKEPKILDFGCALVSGAHFNAKGLKLWETNKGPHDIIYKTSKDGLLNFFLQLVSELQQVGTVAAIDMTAYSI